MSQIPFVKLLDGRSIPQLGLGVYQSKPGSETYKAVLTALKLGYRHIDTAAIYKNEEDVGRAIRDSGIPREQLWVTTKLWNVDQGSYERVSAALGSSLTKLGLSYVDLYLLHAPVEGAARLESWRALERLQSEGKARSIGVSNYGVHHLQELLRSSSSSSSSSQQQQLGGGCTVRPATNQIEVSPFLTRAALVDFCQKQGITVSAYSPLTKGKKLNDPRLVALAKKYQRSPAQVLLRWGLQHGYVILPKSVHEARIRENMDVFGFTLSAEDMNVLDAMNEHFVTGWDPTTWK